MRKSLKKAISLGLATAMVVGLGSGMNTQTVNAKPTDEQIAGFMQAPYFAYIGFSTSYWSYHNPFEEAKLGAFPDESELAKLYASVDATTPGVSDYNWATDFVWNAPAKEGTKNDTFRGDTVPVHQGGKGVLVRTSCQIPDITYDGTYTTSMTLQDKDANVFDYNYGFHMLYVDTNIPYSVENVKFSNISLSIDGGAPIYSSENVVLRNKTDSKYTYQLMVINDYGYSTYEKGKEAVANTKGDAVPDPIWEAALAAGDVTKAVMPKKSISITFTVSGMGEKPADYVSQDKSTNAVSDGAIQVATPAAVLEEGTVQKVGGAKYVVTNAEKKTVAYKAPTKKNIKSATIPAKVKLTVDGEKVDYKVTAVSANAFKGCTKLKSVTLGANVKTIKKNAFKGCKNLAKLNAKAKLSKVEKKAFAGCKKTIKVSGKSKKANVKALKKSGYKKFK